MNDLSASQEKLMEKREVIAEYDVKGYSITIYRKGNSIFYTAKPLFDFNQDPLLFTELASLVHKNKDRLGRGILVFDELVDTLKSICLWKILEIDNLPIDPEVFAELFIHKLIKLDNIIFFFFDDLVDEIYMDQMHAPLYVDHQEFGRCNTNFILEEEEIKSLITRIKLEHPISISSKKPSLKIEFQTKTFHMRISMDFPPISPNGPTFNIRKLKRNPLRVLDLVKLKSFPTQIAAYLVEAINERKNITIIGEPSSGKTTLANAIDLYTPKYWRKVAIEDAIESISQSSLGYKQLSIQVDSFESNKSLHTKTTEILKLLHRSPDWIYLGEIQSREHTQAMFEALNAGLRGIQTAHADSVEKIFRRWKNLHNISETDFMSLDIIIIMKRVLSENTFIREISEIYEVNKNSEVNFNDSNFLIKIYNSEFNENKIIENIKSNSVLRNKIMEIEERNNAFLQELNGKEIEANM